VKVPVVIKFEATTVPFRARLLPGAGVIDILSPKEVPKLIVFPVSTEVNVLL